MNKLLDIFNSFHELIEKELQTARCAFNHPVAKGDASESVWVSMLNEYLPQRYRVAKARAIDSTGNLSDQLDVVIFDRQYTPFIFTHKGQYIIPAESIYAVFEAKQKINADNVKYAMNKVKSVRKLIRTSLPIPTANGMAEPKEPHRIVGGLLSLESAWSPPFGKSLEKNLTKGKDSDGYLDLGCVASHGVFIRQENNNYLIKSKGKPAASFLLELISQLQALATVPMINVRAYAKWLDDSSNLE